MSDYGSETHDVQEGYYGGSGGGRYGRQRGQYYQAGNGVQHRSYQRASSGGSYYSNPGSVVYGSGSGSGSGYGSGYGTRNVKHQTYYKTYAAPRAQRAQRARPARQYRVAKKPVSDYDNQMTLEQIFDRSNSDNPQIVMLDDPIVVVMAASEAPTTGNGAGTTKASADGKFPLSYR